MSGLEELRRLETEAEREELAQILGKHYGTSAAGDDHLWAMADILIERDWRKLPRITDALDAVLALAEGWAALGPEGDWAEGGMADTVLSDAGRAVTAAITKALEGDDHA